MSKAVPILIERDATLGVRSGRGDTALVARFLEPVKLYRVVDEHELIMASRRGVVTGGHFSTDDERAHGASWAGSPEGLADWGRHWQENKRLRPGPLYVLEASVPVGTRFFHLGPKLSTKVSATSIPEVRASFPLSECNTGLGCSAAIPIEDILVYRVGRDGALSALQPQDFEKHVATRAQKVDSKLVDLHPISDHFLSGYIAGASVSVAKDHTDNLWSVRFGKSKPLVDGAKSSKAAAEEALRIMQSPVSPPDTVFLNKRPRGFAYVEKDDVFERKRGYGIKRIQVRKVGASYVDATVLKSDGDMYAKGEIVTIFAPELMADFKQVRED